MQTFIINTIKQIPTTNKKLDIKSTLKTHEWLVYTDSEGEIEKFLFRNKDDLLVTVNGRASNSKWQFMEVNSSLLIDDGINKYMFNVIVCCKDIIVLNIDSTNNYSFLINTKSKVLKDANWWDIRCFLMKRYDLDFFNETERVAYQETEKKELEKRAKKVWGFMSFLGVLVLLLLVVFVVKGVVINSKKAKQEKEYKRTHPDMLFTRPENRKAVDLGLSVKWATCNIGANKPTEKGNEYGWGDSSGVIYTISSGDLVDEDFYGYVYPKRFEPDPPTSIVGTGYDVAKQCWGGNWRMPTLLEAQELIDNCEFVIQNNCIVAFGPSGDSIVFPNPAIESLNYYKYATGEMDTRLIVKSDRRNTICSYTIGQEMLNGGPIMINGKPKVYANTDNAFRSDMLPVRAVCEK